MDLKVISNDGQSTASISASDTLFGREYNEALVHQIVTAYMANARSGNRAQKGRADVNKSTRKPWRQKGTGRARAGSTRSPLWRSGGVTFGPQPRDYSYRMPRKARRQALKSVLAAKLADEQFIVLESLELTEPRTKEGVKLMSSLKLDSALFVDSHTNKNLILATRNLPKVKAVDQKQLTVYDVLDHKVLVLIWERMSIIP